jgi:L-2,4-diaminobutyric acid acetyltransferase
MNNSLLDITLRPPTDKDGPAVFQLINRCPPLDTNSLYCNLLQCTHFAETSVAATINDEIVGFISGYLIPGQTDTLFIWQVAVSNEARGQGLGTRMLKNILSRPLCDQVVYLETTITESNRPSWALFEGIAEKLTAQINTSVLFDRNRHFAGEHESEVLVRIGPINSSSRNSEQT